MTQPPSTQGVHSGLVGLFVFAAAIVLILLLLGLRWQTIPFSLLLLAILVGAIRRILIRLRTLTLVKTGRLSIAKTVSVTDAWIKGIDAQLGMNVLQAELRSNNAYETQADTTSNIRGIWTKGRGEAIFSADDLNPSAVQLRYHASDKGAVWAHVDIERDIQRFAQILHAQAKGRERST